MNVAVVGATGAVGDLIRTVLAERNFPVRTIKFLASEKSVGKSVTFAGKTYPVEPIRAEAFAGVQIVLSSTPSSVSKEFSPIAASLDFHGNVSPQMAETANILVGYQTYPHVDQRERGLLAARLLVRAVKG